MAVAVRGSRRAVELTRDIPRRSDVFRPVADRLLADVKRSLSLNFHKLRSCRKAGSTPEFKPSKRYKRNRSKLASTQRHGDALVHRAQDHVGRPGRAIPIRWCFRARIRHHPGPRRELQRRPMRLVRLSRVPPWQHGWRWRPSAAVTNSRRAQGRAPSVASVQHPSRPDPRLPR